MNARYDRGIGGDFELKTEGPDFGECKVVKARHGKWTVYKSDRSYRGSTRLNFKYPDGSPDIQALRDLGLDLFRG